MTTGSISIGTRPRRCARRRAPPWQRRSTSPATRPRSMPRAGPRAAWSRRHANRSRRWSGPSRAMSCSPRAAPKPTCWRSRRRPDRAGPAPCDRLLVSAIEHPSVLAGGRFPATAVERLPVTADWPHRPRGARAPARRARREGPRPLVSLMLANNETGIIQPVSQAARLVHAGGRRSCMSTRSRPLDEFLAISMRSEPIF